MGSAGGKRREPLLIGSSPLETSTQSTDPVQSGVLEPLKGFQKFNHGSWETARRKVFAALVRTGQPPSRCRSFAECGGSPLLFYVGESVETATELRLVARHCHDRLCTPCAVARAWELRHALAAELEGRDHSFITLTKRSTAGEPLKQCVDALYAAFSDLRRTKLWKDAIIGGAAFLEITRGANGDHWHAHLHCICDARWIEKKLLAYQWFLCTKDSYRVDVQRSSGHQSAAYLTKYVTKSLSGGVLTTPDLLDEFIIAMKGRRLVTTFGRWYGKQTLEDPPEELAAPVCLSGWKDAGLLRDIWPAVQRSEILRAQLDRLPYFRWLRTNADPSP